MSLNEQLLAAAALAQADEVAAIIKKGANVNADDENGETALMKAAGSKRKGRVDTVRCLIEAGANVNRKDKSGNTALMCAVSGRVNSSLDTIRILINAGADINAQNRLGSGALAYAISKKCDTRVHFLVNQGAKIDSVKEAEKTFSTLIDAAWNKRLKGNIAQICEDLHRAGLFHFSKEKMLVSAMRCGQDEHTEIAKYLIQSGADINCLQEDLHHYFDYAMRRCNVGTLSLLIKSGLKSRLLDLDYELHNAAKYGYAEIVKLLIESGANIDKAKAYTQESLGETTSLPLSILARSRFDLERGMLLLKIYDAKYGASSKRASTKEQIDISLLHAAAFGDVATVSQLIQKGASINACDDDNRTPIMISAIFGHANIVKMLIDANADINEVDAKGGTALSYAVQSDVNIAALLIDAGATINIVDAEGYTPLMLAISDLSDNLDIINTLVKAGADVNIMRKGGTTALMDAARAGREDAIKILLEAGAKTDVINDKGWSALMSAAWGWNVPVMELLIAAGAKINNKNRRGETALTRAITSKRIPSSSRYPEIAVQWLIEHGADINAVDKDGWSPLKKAAWRGHTEIVKLLIEAGADVDVVDNGGWTALMAAEHEGHKEIVALLKEAGASKHAPTLPSPQLSPGRGDIFSALTRAQAKAADMCRAAVARLLWARWRRRM